MGIVNIVEIKCDRCLYQERHQGDPVDILYDLVSNDWHIVEDEETLCPDCNSKNRSW